MDLRRGKEGTYLDPGRIRVRGMFFFGFSVKKCWNPFEFQNFRLKFVLEKNVGFFEMLRVLVKLLDFLGAKLFGGKDLDSLEFRF